MDPLNRTTKVNTYPDHDTITYPGANNQQHVITIRRAPMDTVMDSAAATQTLQCLFPELNGSSSSTYDPTVITSVTLPDQSSYSFLYNVYGEPSLMTLPTGGRTRYVFPQAQSCQANTGSGVIPVNSYSGYSIYRRVIEKLDFADGYNLSGKTEFPTPAYGTADATHGGGSNTVAEVDFEDQGGQLLRREKHWFYGNPSGPAALPSDPTQYGSWPDGHEYMTEVSDNQGAFQRQEQVWAQRACASGENCWFNPQDRGAPAHDPLVCQNNRVLENGQNAATVFAYDRYNNLTDQYEYDYGAGPVAGPTCPGVSSGWTRHTATSYRADAAYLDPNVHLISLPSQTRTFGSDGTQGALTDYEYDEVDSNHSLSDTPNIPQHDSAYSAN